MWQNANGNNITTGLLLQAYRSLNENNASDCDAFFEYHCPGNYFSTTNRAQHLVVREP